MQQMFSDYQMQQMSDNLVDSFGFNDGEESSTGMKRFLNFNFGLDEVSGSASATSASAAGNDDTSDIEKAESGNGQDGDAGAADNGKDLFDMVCKDRFGSIDGGEEATMEDASSAKKEPVKSAVEANSSEGSSEEDEEEEEVEDPWAARTKEIKFAAGSPEAASKEAKTDPVEKVPETKMEVDEEEDDDDDWSEVLERDRKSSVDQSSSMGPRDVAPIDPMEVGNPWDSAGAIASSPTHETSFDVAFNSPPPATALPQTSPKPFVIPAAPDVAAAAAENDDSQSTNSVLSEPGTETKSNAGWADFSAFQPVVPDISNTSESQSQFEDSSTQASQVTANSTS